MRLAQLRHVILELGERFGINDFFVIGSAAILAAMPNPPEGALTATRDVDVIAPGDDERLADQISWVMGEASDFDRDYGYYVEGVTSATPSFAPRDWKSRTISVRAKQYTAHCMEAHDLVLSKLGIGREKDLEFASAVVDLNLVQQATFSERLPEMTGPEQILELVKRRIARLYG